MPRYDYDPNEASSRTLAEMFIVELGLGVTPIVPERPIPFGWRLSDYEKHALIETHDIYELTGKSVEQMVKDNNIPIALPHGWDEDLPDIMKIGTEPREAAIPRNVRRWLISAAGSKDIDAILAEYMVSLNKTFGTKLSAKIGSFRDYAEIAQLYKENNPDSNRSIYGSRTGREHITTIGIRTTTEVQGDRGLFISNDAVYPTGIGAHLWPGITPRETYALAPVIFGNHRYNLVK